MSKELAIKLCLERIKRCISSGDVLFVNRSKNLQTLFDLGLTEANVFDELLKLRPENYFSGPETDRDATEGQIWIFLHPLEEKKIYAKLKFFSSGSRDFLKIISFHEEGGGQ